MLEVVQLCPYIHFAHIKSGYVSGKIKVGISNELPVPGVHMLPSTFLVLRNLVIIYVSCHHISYLVYKIVPIFVIVFLLV